MNRLIALARTHLPLSLVAILAVAFVLRAPLIPYGLPYHLYGDEEVNVYSALKMLELKTVIPVLHADAFVPLLYEPPVTPYLYVLAFLPALGIDYLVHGMPSVSDFKNALILDPSLLWYVARMLGVLFALGSIVLTHRIALKLFQSQPVALFAAAFLAASFIDVTISATARLWPPSIFLSLLSLVLVLSAFGKDGKGQHVTLCVAGAALGCAVGTSYVVYLAPLLVFLIPYLAGKGKFLSRESFMNLVWFSIPAAAIGLSFMAVHPYPIFSHTSNEVTGSVSEKPFGPFFAYFGSVLLSYELPLILFAILGLVRLCMSRRDLVPLFVVFFASAIVFIYALFFTIARYLAPLIPLLALLAGYGAAWLSESTRMPRTVRTAFFCALILYALFFFWRVETLALANDTRTSARAWVLENVPAGSVLIVNSENMDFFGTRESLEMQQALAPETLRAADRALLSGAEAAQRFRVYPLAAASADARPKLLADAVTNTGDIFIIHDSWASTDPTGLPAADIVREFTGSGNVLGAELPIGGQPAVRPSALLIESLYRIEALGPDITISRIRR